MDFFTLTQDGEQIQKILNDCYNMTETLNEMKFKVDNLPIDIYDTKNKVVEQQVNLDNLSGSKIFYIHTSYIADTNIIIDKITYQINDIIKSNYIIIIQLESASGIKSQYLMTQINNSGLTTLETYSRSSNQNGSFNGIGFVGNAASIENMVIDKLKITTW